MKADCYAYVRRYYCVPAYIGMKVTVHHRTGVLVGVGGGDQYLHVLFEGNKQPAIFHPTDKVKYFVCPSLPKERDSEES